MELSFVNTIHHDGHPFRCKTASARGSRWRPTAMVKRNLPLLRKIQRVPHVQVKKNDRIVLLCGNIEAPNMCSQDPGICFAGPVPSTPAPSLDPCGPCCVSRRAVPSLDSKLCEPQNTKRLGNHRWSYAAVSRAEPGKAESCLPFTRGRRKGPNAALTPCNLRDIKRKRASRITITRENSSFLFSLLGGRRWAPRDMCLVCHFQSREALPKSRYLSWTLTRFQAQ